MPKSWLDGLIEDRNNMLLRIGILVLIGAGFLGMHFWEKRKAKKARKQEEDGLDGY